MSFIALMLRELDQLLPALTSTLGTYLALGGVVVGLWMWLMGSHTSKGLIALVLVAVGGMVGRYLPEKMGWSVSGLAMAVGLALAGGVLGLLLHRLWVGVGLGVVLAIWGMCACWVFMHGDYQPNWQEIGEKSQNMTETIRHFWDELPKSLQTGWTITAAAGLLAGIVMTMLWPRLTKVMMYSMLGVTLFASLGVMAMQSLKPEWLSYLPQQTWSQIAWLAGVVIVGIVVQWQYMPHRHRVLVDGHDVEVEDDE
ncbi:MAG: hypothetical protein IT448_06720 [Phycisphaerales bacterium]|nr:hypothetical protein [Phycisphaerales bacterium]